jgi:hypothetical protein
LKGRLEQKPRISLHRKISEALARAKCAKPDHVIASNAKQSMDKSLIYRVDRHGGKSRLAMTPASD